MTLQPGEVVLIRIDFHKAAGGKLRPAVVLLDSAMARGWLEYFLDDSRSQAHSVGEG